MTRPAMPANRPAVAQAGPAMNRPNPGGITRPAGGNRPGGGGLPGAGGTGPLPCPVPLQAAIGPAAGVAWSRWQSAGWWRLPGAGGNRPTPLPAPIPGGNRPGGGGGGLRPRRWHPARRRWRRLPVAAAIGPAVALGPAAVAAASRWRRQSARRRWRPYLEAVAIGPLLCPVRSRGGNRPGGGGNRPGIGNGNIGSGNIGQIGNNQNVVNRQNFGGNTINNNVTNISNINNSYRGGNRNINNNYGGGAWFGGGGYGSGYNRGPVINNYYGGRYGRGWASPYYGSWYRGGWGGSGFWAGFGTGALTSFGLGALGSAFRYPGYGYGGYGYPAYGYSSMGIYDYFPTWGMSTYGAWGLAPVASTMLYSGYTNPYYQTVVAAQPAQTTVVYDYSQPINVTSRAARPRGRTEYRAGFFGRARLVQSGGLPAGPRPGRPGLEANSQCPGRARIPGLGPLCSKALRRGGGRRLRGPVGGAWLELVHAGRALSRRRGLHQSASRPGSLRPEQSGLNVAAVPAGLSLPCRGTQ